MLADARHVASKTAIDVHIIDSIQKHIYDTFQPRRVIVGEALDNIEGSFSHLSTGDDQLDGILDGGLPMRQITEFVSESQQNLTKTLLFLASNVSLTEDSKVIVCDTFGFATPNNLKCMTSANIYIQETTSITALYDFLSKVALKPMGLTLLIVHSWSLLFLPYLNGQTLQGKALLMRCARLIKRISIQQNIPTIVRVY